MDMLRQFSSCVQPLTCMDMLRQLTMNIGSSLPPPTPHHHSNHPLMSHERSHDRIELQRYFSENDSVLSGPHPINTSTGTTMSASGSFTGVHSSTPIPIVQHTDADPTQNPTYSSIPETHHQYRTAHAQLAQQVCVCVCVCVNNRLSEFVCVCARM